MICDLNNVQTIIKEEGLNLLVVSYGGCVSNTLVNELEKNNYNCNTKVWRDILCHCPKYIEIDIPIIYIYDNPIKSFISMKNRNHGYWDINQQKLSNNNNADLTDENLIKLMINQFNSWTNVKRDNVLIIKSCELFEDSIINKLEGFLKKKLYNFPIVYNKPKTDITNNINIELLPLFEKYKSDIDKINNFSCELFEDSIINKLEGFLKKKLYNFPIVYNKPKTDITNNINIELLPLFEKYKSDIDKINNFVS
jgi:hypothetical protein